MNKEQIGLIIIAVYLLVGIVIWILGIKQFDGDESYIEYLRKDLHLSVAAIPFIFLVFIVMWPYFIRSK